MFMSISTVNSALTSSIHLPTRLNPKGNLMKKLNQINVLKTLFAAGTLIAAVTAAHAMSHAGAPMTKDDAKKEMPMAAPSGTSGTAGTADMAEGEVRKVDMTSKKITLKHGEIKSMDMPPMTMVFQVKDAAMLEKVKAGDKVRFKAEKSGGAMVVTEIQTTR
jgi:Cu(I)/Ag(I) efflux system periplasmic protein CusF